MARMGLINLIGTNQIFESRHKCIQAYQLETRGEEKSPALRRPNRPSHNPKVAGSNPAPATN